MDIFKNKSQVIASTQVLGKATVEMLFQVHQDALWMLENMGVGCLQPEIVDAFRRYETDGKAIAYENRIYITGDLVKECLATVPGLDQFFVPRNSLFIGGRAPYVYDDSMGKGGVLPVISGENSQYGIHRFRKNFQIIFRKEYGYGQNLQSIIACSPHAS